MNKINSMPKILSKSGIFLLFLALFIFNTCTPTKKLKYVQNTGDDIQKNEYYNDRSEKLIQPYDYLYVKIFSLDEKTNSIFNNERGSAVNDNELLSYAVDDKGYINLPFIGQVFVKDMSINQAKEKIEKSFEVYLNNISIIVRFVGNKITILGEVNSPGQYSFYDEKINVFQALSFANGNNTFGDLTDITLIREKDNKITYYNLDLTNKSVVASPNYYLLPNDVLIINPINAKYRDLRDYALNLTDAILSTIASVLTIILVTNSLQIMP
jgi:polysaccharide biosynthesis/export protein